MEDIEKTRVEYVQRLEQQLQHAQTELAKHKALSEKWAPVVNAEMSSENELVKISLTFGGKAMSVTLAYNYILQTDETTLISGTVDVLANSIIADRLREVIRPEVQRAIQGVNAIKMAGKW